MRHVAIVARSEAGPLRARLERDLAAASSGVTIHPVRRGPYTFLWLELPAAPSPPGGRGLLEPLATALADALLDLEPLWVERIVRMRCHGLGRTEQARVWREALVRLGRQPPPPPRVEVSRLLAEHLAESDVLVVEGFLRFRLRPYFRRLSESVEAAFQEHLLEEEYRSFLRLVQQFVGEAEPAAHLVHVIRDGGGGVALLDAEGERLESEFLEGWAARNGVGPDPVDQVVSALIALAPAEIRLHLGPEETVAYTVQLLFGRRASPCPGCRLCRPLPRPLGRGQGAPSRDDGPPDAP